jgi:(1->4)-alpha-D-glucan 1-alpha-D-glucosylmutase
MEAAPPRQLANGRFMDRALFGSRPEEGTPMPLIESGHTPSSTYRVQLHREFNFGELEDLAPYFADLGISDVYLSPIFKSVPGSQHGYDVTDFSEINPELGGGEGFSRLAAVLRSNGCRIILDFVPNHMGIEGLLNQRWRDVLEHGPESRYASFFDIQWKAESNEDHPRVLVPLLADQYGKVLEQGELKLVLDNGLSLRHQQATLPLRPETYAPILEPLDCAGASPEEGEAIRHILAALSEGIVPAPDTKNAAETILEMRSERLKERLETAVSRFPGLKGGLEARLSELNGTVGDSGSFDELHSLIERQHYRLARWQYGAHEINYRRFFAIDTLVGLHMENPEVFRECHALLSGLLATGDVSGLRIDHIDGLLQPEAYLRRLQTLTRADREKPLYVLVEKILERHEALPASWPVHGTTGYEFMRDAADILVDSSQATRLDTVYRRFAADNGYEPLVTSSKRLIISEMFANAVSNLGAELMSIVSGDRMWRDLTRHELTTAVSELAAHMQVYRTYRKKTEPLGDEDSAVMADACSRAVADNPRADPQALHFVRDILIGLYPKASAPAEYRSRLLSWVLMFQQYTGAIMAKSVEDTAFYNYNRLVGLNEVGGDPGTIGGTLANFHSTNASRLENSPLSLLATSTHDSKFSEDVRARLYAISELTREWEAWIEDWRAKTGRHVGSIEGHDAPDALDQYRFFQVLLGVWPLSEDEVDDAFRSRLREHFRKSVDEAKRHTSIMNRNESYLAACDRFVDCVTTTQSGEDFLEAFRPCARRVARIGMVNSLAQLVIKCTAPGVPDFYQGNETWNFSLVDPDNRRLVDFGARLKAMNRIRAARASDLLTNWRDGGIKLRVTRDLLRLRREIPNLFAIGSYGAIAATGTFSANVVSYCRKIGTDAVIVVVPRVAAKLGCPPLGAVWEDTRLDGFPIAAEWQDVLTGRTYPGDQPLFLRSILSELPVAVLRRRERTE